MIGFSLKNIAKLSLFLGVGSFTWADLSVDSVLVEYSIYGVDGVSTSSGGSNSTASAGKVGSANDIDLSAGSDDAIRYHLTAGGDVITDAQNHKFEGNAYMKGDFFADQATFSGETYIGGSVSLGNSPLTFDGDLNFGGTANNISKLGWNTVQFDGGAASTYSNTTIIDNSTPGVPASVQWDQPEPEIPIFTTADFPDTVVTAGSTDILVNGANSGLVIPPGAYGNLTLASGSYTLNLGEGVYIFNNVSLAPGGGAPNIIATQPNGARTKIIVTGTFTSGNGQPVIKPSDDARGMMMMVFQQSTDVVFGTDFSAYATLSAPNAAARLKHGFALYGQIFAKEIIMDGGFDGDDGAFVPFNPDKPVIGLVGSFPTTVLETAGVINIPVTQSIVNGQDVSVDYLVVSGSSGSNDAIEGSDFNFAVPGTAKTGTFNFPKNVISIDSIGINIVDDILIEEPDEFFEVWLLNPVAARFANDKDTIKYQIFIDSEDMNNPPVARDTIISVDENPANGLVLLNNYASDVDGDSITYVLLSGNTGNPFSMSVDGEIAIATPSEFDYESGKIQYTLRVIVSDVATPSFSDTNTIVINVNDVNDIAPVALPDTIVVDEGGTVNVLTNGNSSILDNDTDVDSPVTGYTVTDGVDRASSSTFNPNGTFSYTHDGSEVFTDYFDYTPNDGVNTGTAVRVVIQINPINDNAPVGVDDMALGQEGETITLLASGNANLTTNDTDADMPFDSLFINSTPMVNSLYGVLTLNSVGTFQYVHDGSENKLDSFAYEVIDRANQKDTAWVRLSLDNTNDRPVFNPLPLLSVEENLPAGQILDTITATDVDSGTMLIYSFVTPVLGVDIDSLTGEITTTATFNYEEKSTYDISVRVFDGLEGTVINTVINITDANDTPTANDTTTTVPESVSPGDSILQVIALDEDNDPLNFFISDTTQPFVISPTGVVSIKSGETLDYELGQRDYSVIVFVSDGLDTIQTTVELTVINSTEKSSVTIVKAENEEEEWLTPDTLFTNLDSINVVWNQGGTIVNDPNLLAEGDNLIQKIFLDSTKDVPDTAWVFVSYNPNAPIITDVNTDIPVDTATGVYYINDDTLSIGWNIEYLTETGVSAIDTNIVPDYVEGEQVRVVVEYTDKWGNTTIDTIWVVLDTTKPVVEITSPADSTDHFSLFTEVEWNVDGIEQTEEVRENLLKGGNWIVRSATDLAGNVGIDSIWVRVILEDNRIEVEVVDNLITDLTTTPDEFYSILGREKTPERENFNISIYNPASNELEEIYYQDGIVTRFVEKDDRISYPLDTERLGIVLDVNLQFPFNGGFNQFDNSARPGICDDGEPMWQLNVDLLTVHVFDHSGQYVTTVQMPGFLIDDPEYQDDNGKVNFFIEIPRIDENLKSKSGQKWANGIFLLNTLVQTSASPINCNEDWQTNSRYSDLKKVGYRRYDQ